MAKFSNPIVETYKGRNIRKYNTINIRLSPTEYKKFIDAKMDYGLSERDLLEISGRPCDCCKNTDVISYDKNDDPIYIKRGILCSRP